MEFRLQPVGRPTNAGWGCAGRVPVENIGRCALHAPGAKITLACPHPFA